MDETALRRTIMARLSVRLQRLGLTDTDLRDDLDLVRSGVLDSLGFVDLVAELEAASGKQVDLERALDRPGATTFHGIITLFR